jgi:acyl-[acyl-carrier-protein]-phospholipid O-acyltransferase/long-chain-fatty-acid--[acyl-carrier-protein] ligase
MITRVGTPLVAAYLAALILIVALAIGIFCWFRTLTVLRGIVWLIGHTFYRIRIGGLENVPKTGACLLVCNHVSYIDWLFLVAVQRRLIRFVILKGWTKRWGMRHILRWSRTIPIDDEAGPRSILKSLHTASDALKAGELVCIFAEGALTRSGTMLPFHRGMELILKRCPAPIIPVCLDQVWGSIFSYYKGKVIWKWPQEMPYPVRVSFGPPLPPTTTAAEVRMAIQKLSADSALRRTKASIPVHRQFVRMAAKHPFRPCFIDTLNSGKIYRQGEALAGAMILTRLLKPILGDEPMVGLWLPPGVGSAVANITLALLGKTSVNLNYSSPMESIQSAVRQCNIKHVLTSPLFLKRFPIDPGPGVSLVHLDDFRKQVTKFQRLRAFLAVALLPGWVLEHWVLGLGHHSLDSLATIIFSSGSTGEPKGVMLTHRNIAANAESMVQAIDLRASDRVLGILPFFHSFGYTVTLWAPLQVAASAVYYNDPRQAKEIGELCRKHQCTIFLTTPTFLRFCLRRSEVGDFDSLRILMCGAEKLPQTLAQEFQKKFGVLPLEGYGCTELSPAAAANLPDKDINGVKQVCNKSGTIGHPLPGVAARIANPETLETLPPGEEGLLLIYGANVMKGYLGSEDLTKEVIRDGWYSTGDMGFIDEDGFITITGRLSRFAKIGGEMVPLERIEEELHGILATNDRVCAVTCVPDEKKGERLVVLFTPQEKLDVKCLTEKLSHRGLPNLWVPDERDYYSVPELPILGSGKVNLQKLKAMAMELAANGRK